MVEVVRGHLHQAAKHFEQALEVKHDCAEAHMGLGQLLLREKKQQEGMTHLREAVQISPTNGEAHLYLGLALDQQGDGTGAVQHLRLASRYAPTLDRVWIALGMALRRQGQNAEAKECFYRAAQISQRRGGRAASGASGPLP
jgi:Flp pilus assembly protein TadD